MIKSPSVETATTSWGCPILSDAKEEARVERVKKRGMGVAKGKNKIDSFFFPKDNVEKLSKNVDILKNLYKRFVYLDFFS